MKMEFACATIKVILNKRLAIFILDLISGSINVNESAYTYNFDDTIYTP